MPFFIGGLMYIKDTMKKKVMDVSTFAKIAAEDENYLKELKKSKAQRTKIAKEFMQDLLDIMEVGETVELPLLKMKSEYVLKKINDTTFSLKPI
jgi:hypothetical protein